MQEPGNKQPGKKKPGNEEPGKKEPGKKEPGKTLAAAKSAVRPAQRLPPPARGDFLPDLCTVLGVFHLVLVGELLAIALTLFDRGLLDFNWNLLGVSSMLIQWIILSSAAVLCPLRPWLRRQGPRVAGGASFTAVLLVALTISALSGLIPPGEEGPFWDRVATHLLITAVFAGIVLRYFYLQQQLRNQQQSELEARIQALQARIRPHFLFNSMNSIASLIATDPAAAEKMVVDLSDLFRASLTDQGLIPLQQELSLCQRFAEIEQIRLGPRLQVVWDIQYLPEALIPGLLLQPILENAIFHGIQPRKNGGRVEIIVRGKDDVCEITVTNPLADSVNLRSKGTGVALENIRHRLHAYYGDKAGLELGAEAGCYRVRLYFPSIPPARG